MPTDIHQEPVTDFESKSRSPRKRRSSFDRQHFHSGSVLAVTTGGTGSSTDVSPSSSFSTDTGNSCGNDGAGTGVWLDSSLDESGAAISLQLGNVAMGDADHKRHYDNLTPTDLTLATMELNVNAETSVGKLTLPDSNSPDQREDAVEEPSGDGVAVATAEPSSAAEAEDHSPLFCPPLYRQRYSFVRDILTRHDVTSVVDFGCAEPKLLAFLKFCPNIEVS